MQETLRTLEISCDMDGGEMFDLLDDRRERMFAARSKHINTYALNNKQHRRPTQQLATMINHN